jgi:hypothetical protein
MVRTKRFSGAGLMLLLLIFVGLAALFMGAVAISPETDTSNRIIACIIFLSLSASTVQFVFGFRRAALGSWLTNRRWRHLGDALRSMGFRDAKASEIDETVRLPVHVLLPSVLAVQRGGGIDHVTIGSLGGQEVRAFNVRIRGGGWYDVPAVALFLPASLAPTLVRPVKNIKIPPRPGMRSVRFESEQFNRSVGVFSSDPFFASAMIDARMMEWLMEASPRAVIELSDRWAVAWALPKTGRHLSPVDLIAILKEFDRHIPRAVPSLFPRSETRLLWKTG